MLSWYSGSCWGYKPLANYRLPLSSVNERSRTNSMFCYHSPSTPSYSRSLMYTVLTVFKRVYTSDKPPSVTRSNQITHTPTLLILERFSVFLACYRSMGWIYACRVRFFHFVDPYSVMCKDLHQSTMFGGDFPTQMRQVNVLIAGAYS